MTKDAPELGCCDLSFEGVVWAGGWVLGKAARERIWDAVYWMKETSLFLLTSLFPPSCFWWNKGRITWQLGPLFFLTMEIRFLKWLLCTYEHWEMFLAVLTFLVSPEIWRKAGEYWLMSSNMGSHFPALSSLICWLIASWLQDGCCNSRWHVCIQGTKKWERVVKTPAVFVIYFRRSKSFPRRCLPGSQQPELGHFLDCHP